jgi:two-component system NtrC family sensor kinase
MPMDNHIYIELEEFDREYGLPELLPAALAAELLEGIQHVLPTAILLPGGGRYFGEFAMPPEQAAAVARAFQAGAEDFCSCQTDQGPALAFVLVHELETIAYLVIRHDHDAVADARLVQMGRLSARAINRMIYLNCKTRMAAGLHGQVVTESYVSLQEKAEQLQRSEEKYRRLAENLEVEVQKKTREIKEAQLNMLRQEKMAAVGQLAAGMAHEINNPIGFVISNLNTLKENTQETTRILEQYRHLGQMLSHPQAGGVTAAAIQKIVADIHGLCEKVDLDFKLQDTRDLIEESLGGAERVKKIVRTLCDFTHPSIETPEKIDINTCLDVTLSILSGQIPKDVNILKDYQKIPDMHCNLREMNQVFFNLLRNALQAVGARGIINISTRSADEQIEISISDNGSGIQPEALPRIFDPFFTTREVGSGIGLGLNLTYNIVRKHGGSITVNSVAGHGSTFTVRFPGPQVPGVVLPSVQP